VVGLSLVGGFVVTKLQKPEYQSEATIFVSPRGSSVPLATELSQLPGIAGLAGVGVGGLGTEAGLLQSRAIVEAVVDSLALHVTLENSIGSRTEVLRIYEAPRTATPGRFELAQVDSITYRVTALAGAAAPVPTTIRVREPFQLGDARLALLPHRNLTRRLL